MGENAKTYNMHVYITALYPCHIHRYSRRILWLNVGTSNNDPALILHHYLEVVEKLQGTMLQCQYNLNLVSYCLLKLKCIGTPQVLRCDPGTENSTIAFIHAAFPPTQWA